jgi:D-methionine transport system ATP-binding protein
MISVEHVCRNFGNLNALRDVSFSVARGEIFGIVGHSGAGKSTLLRCLNGLERYGSGTIRVMGREVAGLGEEELRDLRRGMGMVFQNFGLMERKNVAENVAWPLDVWKVPRDAAERRVEELLDIVGLSSKRAGRIRNLSGGEKQRVGIARALALSPGILLCDEPTSALDPATTESILGLLGDINRNLGVTILLVTHQMEAVKRICDRVLLLDRGRVCGCGRTEDVFLSPSPEMKRFVRDDYASPEEGVCVRVAFPREVAGESVVSRMARDLAIDFCVVGGRLERYRDTVLGFLIISVRPEDLEGVAGYLSGKRLLWEVIDDVA